MFGSHGMPAHMLQNSMLGNIYLKLNIFNTSYFVQYKYIHLVQTYPFNIKNSLLNTIFIQHITFYSIQICSVNADIFNTDIFIQCKFLYSIILGLARPDHLTYFFSLAGNISC